LPNSFAKQILPGLVNLRKLQITHNNLNEYSIQVSEDENGNPIFKLDDFSRAFLSGEPPTVNGGYWLTPEYFSGDAVGHPADMWAFGITIFQFLSQDMSISVGDVVNWEYYFGKFPLKFKKGVYKYYGEYGLQSVRPSINYLDPKNVPHDFIDFLKKIMKYDPSKRMTPQEALQHPWLL
jgi:serine/threonine protein kinase